MKSNSAAPEQAPPVPFVDLAAQHQALRDELTAVWFETLDQTDFILGRAVDAFEGEFAAFCGTKAAVGVGNGLDALRLTLWSLGIAAGDEVILPANTFIATALSVTQCAARPVLVDCDAGTFNLDPALVEKAVNSKTKAILPVHFGGLPADMESINRIANKHGLFVVEDACQAHGAIYHGQACGGLAAAGCFSFYPAKNLGALGDGGIVTTNNAGLAENLRRLRNYGQRAKYDHATAGCNSRLDSLQAAILRVKLRHLHEWNAARRQHAARYIERLRGVGDLSFQQLPPELTPVYHLFIVQTDLRDALREYLAAQGIQTGIHYPIPVHLQKAYSDLGYHVGDFPVAEKLAARCLSLPMYPELTETQVDRVINAVVRFFSTEGKE